MAVVKSERIKIIEELHGRPLAAILNDLVHSHSYSDICARLGGISRRTLIYWMEKYQIQGPGRGARSKTALHKATVSAALKGRPRSEEVKKKISDSLKGRELSEETCKKISESLKEYHRHRAKKE